MMKNIVFPRKFQTVLLAGLAAFQATIPPLFSFLFVLQQRQSCHATPIAIMPMAVPKFAAKGTTSPVPVFEAICDFDILVGSRYLGVASFNEPVQLSVMLKKRF